MLILSSFIRDMMNSRFFKAFGFAVSLLMIIGVILALCGRVLPIIKEVKILVVEGAHDSICTLIAAQSEQFTYLAIFLTIFSLFIAIGGFVGYQGFKDGISRQVDQYLSENFSDILEVKLREHFSDAMDKQSLDSKTKSKTVSAQKIKNKKKK